MSVPSAASHPTMPDPRSAGFIAALSARLAERKLLDPLSARRAERAQQQSGERFDLVLTRLGLVSDSHLAAVLSEILALPLTTPRDLPEAALFPGALSVQYLRTARLVPLADAADAVTVATADPFNTEAVAALAFMLGKPVELRLMAAGDVDQAIARLYGVRADATDLPIPAGSGAAAEAGEADVRRLEDMASEAPIIKLVHDLVVRAVEAQASDIHIEPAEDSVRVRFRIDGVLQTVMTHEPAVRAALASRIKIMAQLNIAERRLPQDGRIKVTVRGREIDLRASTMPTLWGESVVLRILDRASVKLDFAALGFAGPVLVTFREMLAEPNGIILVTGPTGSGKTTTLYTALSLLNDAERKLFSVEDPVEYQLQGVNQVQVNPKIGLTFASALRSILRQDPDIIMIGEIRDLETAEIAIRASLTGHLVLSTVHTNSAAATITRLLDMGVEDYLLASSLSGVLAQRLVRRLCPECAAPADLTPAQRDRLVRLAGRAHVGDARIMKATGCPACHNTGYAGRTTVYELIRIDDAVRDLVVTRGSERDIEEAAKARGMASLLACGMQKVLAGETTVEEVLRVTRVGDAAVQV